MKMYLVCSISGATIQTSVNWQKVRKMAEWFEKVGDYAISLSDYNKKESQRRCDNRYRGKLKAEKAAIERLKRLQMGNYKYYKARNNKAWETRQNRLLEQRSKN